MLTRDDRMRNRDLNNKEKMEHKYDCEKLFSVQIGKLERFYDGMQDRLRELHEERSAIFEVRVSREDFRKHAKAGLAAAKTKVLEIYAKYLEDTHARGIKPFPVGERLFPDDIVHQLAYLALSEKDLDGLVDLLPDGRMTEKEQEAEVKKVDKEIEAVRAELSQKIESAKRGELVLE